MKLAKGYRSENNRILKNNSIPYEEFKICGIHTANQIINAVGHQKMHEDEINTFCCMVNQNKMLCGQILQECFNIGLQEKSDHISCFQCNSSPPFKLDSKRLTSPGIAHILAQPWRSQIVWSTSYVEPEQSAEITLKICLAKHLNSHMAIWLSR